MKKFRLTRILCQCSVQIFAPSSLLPAETTQSSSSLTVKLTLSNFSLTLSIQDSTQCPIPISVKLFRLPHCQYIDIKQLYCDNSTENGKIFDKISLCVQKNVKVKNNKVLRDISSPNTKEFVIHVIIVNIQQQENHFLRHISSPNMKEFVIPVISVIIKQQVRANQGDI